MSELIQSKVRRIVLEGAIVRVLPSKQPELILIEISGSSSVDLIAARVRRELLSLEAGETVSIEPKRTRGVVSVVSGIGSSDVNTRRIRSVQFGSSGSSSLSVTTTKTSVDSIVFEISGAASVSIQTARTRRVQLSSSGISGLDISIDDPFFGITSPIEDEELVGVETITWNSVDGGEGETGIDLYLIESQY